MLHKTNDQLSFLKSRLANGRKLVDIGCGNGRLPIAPVKEGVIEDGLGSDLSESRIAFARAWARDLDLHDHLTFEVADAVSYELGTTEYSAATCITGATAPLHARDDLGSPDRVWILQDTLPRGIVE